MTSNLENLDVIWIQRPTPYSPFEGGIGGQGQVGNPLREWEPQEEEALKSILRQRDNTDPVFPKDFEDVAKRLTLWFNQENKPEGIHFTEAEVEWKVFVIEHSKYRGPRELYRFIAKCLSAENNQSFDNIKFTRGSLTMEECIAMEPMDFCDIVIIDTAFRNRLIKEMISLKYPDAIDYSKQGVVERLILYFWPWLKESKDLLRLRDILPLVDKDAK
ncbi:hypothetical protein HYALB_00010283 [Hymenoscyphus albidus]|uniref:Uncharacterized protein n=1 Tax=Hymenoscyphus albidus TaxID=595503 RepID=A0A9N9Q3F9_9HELO|nr:hypothetical protein HYALB_00010283 [Hymenoscyphus albidus]